MLIRKLVAELLGTAVLVFFAVGTATLAFGFHLQGGSTAAGVVMTSLAFGLVLIALVYAIGPVSGCHVNPAVTLGFVIAGRMTLRDAAGYWAAQLIGGIAGAFALWAVFANRGAYSCAATGLGTDGWGIQRERNPHARARSGLNRRSRRIVVDALPPRAAGRMCLIDDRLLVPERHRFPCEPP